MKKITASFAFVLFAFTMNAQSYPTVSELKNDFEIVFKYIESDISFIENKLGIKLSADQRKSFEAVFYNKYKHIAGSDNLDNFEEVANATAERIQAGLGSEKFTKLSGIENAMVILSGRIYLNPSVLDN